MQAFVLGNFVLSSALLLQKLVVALGLGGLLPGAPRARWPHSTRRASAPAWPHGFCRSLPATHPSNPCNRPSNDDSNLPIN